MDLILQDGDLKYKVFALLTITLECNSPPIITNTTARRPIGDQKFPLISLLGFREMEPTHVCFKGSI